MSKHNGNSNGNGKPNTKTAVKDAPSAIDYQALLEELEVLKQDKQLLEDKRYLDTSLTKFADLMRWGVDSTLQSWSEALLAELVDYVGGLQASIYLIDEEENVLNWIGGYACPSETPKQVAMGEGLTGQAAKSKRTYLYDDPDTFRSFSTTSLSDIPAKVLLVKPLIHNERVEGVLEISGVEAFSQVQLDLIQLLSDSMAANLNTISNQVKMKELFKLAQEKSEELQAQEEELRQNLEELEATQEEMRRVQQEVSRREEEFRRMADNVPGMIYQYYLNPNTGETGFLYASQGVQDIFGISAEAIVEDADANLPEMHPDDLEPFEQSVLESAKTLTNAEGIVRFIMKDGNTLWVRYQSTPVRREDGVVVWNGVMSDHSATRQTEQLIQTKNEELEAQQEELRQNLEELEATQEEMRRTQQAVEDQKALLEGYINSSDDFIVIEDLERRLLMYNEKYAQYMALKGMPVAVGMHADERKVNDDGDELEIFERVTKGESVVKEMEVDIQGTLLVVEATYFPVKDRSGRVIASGVTARDITEKKMRDREVQEINEELQAQQEELRQNLEELEATQEEMRMTQTALQNQKSELNAILNSTEDLIGVMNTKLHLKAFNESYAAAFAAQGYTVKRGMALREFINPEQYEAVEALWMRAINGESFNEEVSYVFNEGQDTMYFYVTYRPLKDEDGKIIGACLFSRDITAQKKQALQLEQQHQLLQSFINNSSDAIIVVDPQLDIMMFNEKLHANYKNSGIDIEAGMSVIDLLPKEQVEYFKGLYERVLKGERFTEHQDFEHPELKMKYVFESDYYPLVNEAGTVYAACVQARELSEEDFKKRQAAKSKNSAKASTSRKRK